MYPILQALISLTIAARLLTITPGLDTALILGRQLLRTRSANFSSSRDKRWLSELVCDSSVGFRSVLLVSSSLYSLIRLLGAYYLLHLGLKVILQDFEILEVIASGSFLASKKNFVSCFIL